MTSEPGAGGAPPNGGAPERVLVLGANGPTGRLVVEQALGLGLVVVASTRHPDAFPLQHERLHVLGGDATDPAVVDSAVAAADAVISVIGASYSRHPVSVYSASARLVIEAMGRHGLRRLIVVTSASVADESSHQGQFFFDHVVHPVLRHVFGRTVYDDMARMEAIVRASDTDWTIVRPPGLTGEPSSGSISAETHVAGMFCARSDLAAFLLAQLASDRFLRRIAAVSSPGVRVTAVQTLRREVLKR